jgi:putative glutamine amidotransferase
MEAKTVKKPLIGVMPLYDKSMDSYWMIPGYMKGILDAGGAPVILPITKDESTLVFYAETLDGFLFTGGDDIDPSIYGQAPLPECGAPFPERDEMEIALFHIAFKMDKPMLGICRGLQLLNVVLGGSLYQDIPTQIESGVFVNHNQNPPYDIPSHTVKLVSGELLSNLFGADEIHVNSSHHQGIRNLARGAAILAESPDGLVEAFRFPGKRLILAVQWHPEMMPDSEEQRLKIFSHFTQACR